MAGYSGTPLPKQLGIKGGHAGVVLGGPKGLAAQLGAKTTAAGKAPLDVIVVFVKQRADLVDKIASLRPRMAPACGLWIAWPKKASGVATDITEQTIRD